MSSADRTPSRQEQAKRKAASLRVEQGVDAKWTVETMLTTRKFLKVFKPSTERSLKLKAELGRFEAFVKEHLLEEDAGKRLWQDWAGGRSLDELMECDDGSAPSVTIPILHAFARWRAAGMKGRIQKRPSVDSVQQVIDLLWTAYGRKTFTINSQDHSVLTSAHAFCATTLKEEFNLHQEQKARRVPDREVLMHVVAALFSTDLVNEYSAFRLYTLLAVNLRVLR